MLFKDVYQDDEEEPIPTELLQEEVEADTAQTITSEEEKQESNTEGEEEVRKRRNSDE